MATLTPSREETRTPHAAPTGYHGRLRALGAQPARCPRSPPVADGQRAIQGQASTLILVLFLGGIQLIVLGIIGEYLGRIYDEVRRRPLYLVRETIDD